MERFQKRIDRFKKTLERLLFPIALMLVVIYNFIANLLGWHVFTWEKIGKFFIAVVLFLMVIGFMYIFYGVVFSMQNKYFDPSFEENRKWKLLTEKEKFKYSYWLFIALLGVFAMVLLCV
jgi:hypothetical protein